MIRIAAANIQNGVGVTRSYGQYALVGWRYVLPHSPAALEGLVRAIEHEKIDVLALSEAEGGSFRSRGINYVNWIAERTELSHHVFFPTFRRSLRGRVLTNQGNAILSRLPLRKHDNHRLPGDGEPRYLGEATIEHGTSTFTVFTTHLSLQRAARQDQLLAIARIAGAREGPKLLMGDFNTPHLEELGDIEAVGLTKLHTGPTFPSWNPQRCLDHVFASDDWNQASAVALESVRVADHLPILATVANGRHDDKPRGDHRSSS